MGFSQLYGFTDRDTEQGLRRMRLLVFSRGSAAWSRGYGVHRGAAAAAPLSACHNHQPRKLEAPRASRA